MKIIIIKNQSICGLAKVTKTLLSASIIWGSVATLCAQGTDYLSNLGEATAGFSVGGSQSFETGAAVNVYVLNSVTLLMGDYIPGGNNFAVAICSDNNGQAGAAIGELTGSNDPESAGEYIYTASDVVLSPATPYWIVATYSPGFYERGGYSWEYTTSPKYATEDSWGIGSATVLPVFPPIGYPQWLQFSLNATPVPEPSVFVLGGLTLGLIALSRFNKRR